MVRSVTAGMVIGAILLSGCEPATRSAARPVSRFVGKMAPDIVGTDMDGTPFRLSDYRGQVVMLDFWGDW